MKENDDSLQLKVRWFYNQFACINERVNDDERKCWFAPLKESRASNDWQLIAAEAVGRAKGPKKAEKGRMWRVMIPRVKGDAREKRYVRLKWASRAHDNDADDDDNVK